MNITPEMLYELLPAIYRLRDAAQGEELKALLSVMAEQMNIVGQDIDQLYENRFIETCDEWLVPYIGDLLGVRRLNPAAKDVYSLRAYVANTLAYRRRKGTPAVLEQLARDVTLWPAKAVEFFQLIVTSQHLNHLRPDKLGTLQICGPGSRDGLELLGGPFEQALHSVDVRRIESQRGKYNLPHIGLYLWRLRSFAMEHATVAAPVGAPAGCFTFSPLGYDMPLFNPPRTEETITHLAEEINVPSVLRRLPLYRELEARRRSIARHEDPAEYYFGDRPVFEIFPGLESKALKPEEIVICNLDGWEKAAWQPPASVIYARDDQGANLTTKLAVDPVLGRMAFLHGADPQGVEVSFSYGFSSGLGGGPYNRGKSLAVWYDPQKRPVTWQQTVTKAKNGQALQEALNAWNAYVQDKPRACGLITITDNRTYPEALPNIVIPAGCSLAVIAGNWLPGKQDAKDGRIEADNLRPHVEADFVLVPGTGAMTHDVIESATIIEAGEFILDGLLVEGTLTVKPGGLGSLRLAHCTLVPGVAPSHMAKQAGSLVIEKGNPDLSVVIDHSILGRVRASASIQDLSVSDSIVASVDEKDAPALSGLIKEPYGPSLNLERSTILGAMRVKELYASESIMTGELAIERCQTGCIRFCYLSLPPDPEVAPQTPPRYRCQPCLEIETQTQQRSCAGHTPDAIEIRRQVSEWLRPSFVSIRYGHPAFAQLSTSCPVQIMTGAEDGSEMGAFCHLKGPQREANLRQALDEYLRAGMEAGIIHAPQTLKEEVKA